MAVVSLRLNKEEEKIVNYLSNYYEQDRSSLIKFSLNELYEDIIDRQAINNYELKEKEGKTKFINSADVIEMINQNKM